MAGRTGSGARRADAGSRGSAPSTAGRGFLHQRLTQRCRGVRIGGTITASTHTSAVPSRGGDSRFHPRRTPTMTLPTVRTRRSPRLTGLLAAVTTVLATAALSTVVATAAHADNPPGPHDPIGAVESISVNPDGSVSARGWAADPDTLSANSTVV